ncbi:hypothetical protein OROMI_001971 [Orobanche minor]
MKKRVARILFFKIRPSQEILKIRHGTPLETEEILTYIKSPQNRSFWHFYSNLDVPSNVVHKKRVARNLFIKIRPSQEILKIRDVARILFFKIRPSQEILKIRHGTPLETEEILTYIKSPQNRSFWHFYSNLDVPSNVVHKKRVARNLFIKIRPSQEILKIRDGTSLEMEEILTYIKKPSKQIVARILFFKIRPSQEILKIRDGTPMEAEEILTYIKSPQNRSFWHFYSNLDVPSNVVHKKRVARNLFIKIRPSQEILKIRDGTSLKMEEILTYIKKPSKQIVAGILFFKIRPSQEILKIRDGTPLEAEEILIYIKKPSNKSVWHFSSKLDILSNVVQKKRVARILFFKIRPSQEILKIRDESSQEILKIRDDNKRVARILFFKIRPSQEILKIRHGTPLETEEILTYIKSPQNRSFWNFYSNLDVPSNVVHKKRVARNLFIKIRPSQEILKIRDDVPINVVQKKRVARILFFKIRPSQEILKIRHGTPLETEEILTYIKALKIDLARILFFKIRPSQEILKIRDDRVAGILFFKIRPSQEILKIRDGTPLEAEEILIYIKKPSNKSVWHFSSKLDILSNVVQKKRVARILFFKIRPSQEILKIRDDMSSQEILKIRDDNKRVARILFFKIRPSQEILKIRHGTPLETEEILTYIKSPQNRSFWNFYSNLDVPSNVVHKKRVARNLFIKIRPSQEILKIRDVQKKRVARILFFKIRPSQEILKIRHGTPLETEEILTYIKALKIDQILKIRHVQKKRVARILFFKIRPSQEILKIRHGTPLETEEILTYIKSPQNRSFWHFYSNLDVPSNVVHKKRVARNLFIKIRPSQEILKIRDVARILFFKIRPSQEILKIRHGTPLETEEILTYIKSPQNRSFWHFYSNLDVPSNVVHKKRVARNLFIKIRPSQEILKIRDGTSLEMEEILTYIKKPSKKIEILKIRDGTPMEAEEILTYIKSPQNRSFWHFYSNLDVPSNVVHKKRVARNLFIKIRPSQEILKIRDGTSLKMEEILTYIKKPSKQIVAGILFFKIRPSQEILKIRDGTPLEAEEILIYIKKPSNKSVWHFSSKLDILSNVVQKKRVARILFFKIRPSQEILKIRDDVPSNVVHKKRVARNLFIKIRSSQEILKIRDGTSLEMEEILTYIKSPQNRSVWHFSSNLDVPINVVQKKRVARILFFKIRPSQEILKIRDVQNKRVARILFFKIRPSQEILKIRHGTPLETEEILTYIKSPQNRSFWNFYSNLDVPSNVVHKKRVARNLFIKIRPSQEILKIRDVQKKRVARILFFKIRPSQEILKIRHGTPSETEEILTYIKALKIDRFEILKIRHEILKIRHGTSLEMEEILTYIKKPSKQIVQKKRVARILFFKIRPSQEILKIRHGTPLETEEILTYIKSPQNRSFWHFYSNLDVPSNVVHKKRVARNLFIKIRPSQEILKIRDVARILFFKIRPSQEILKIRHGTPLETEEILTYIKSPQNRSFWHFYSNLDVPSNVVHKKRVARNLFIKIRPSQEILKIRDGTSLEMEEILTYIKKPSKQIVARILFFKIRPSQEILKIRDGTPMEAEEILTYIKSPQNRSFWHFYSNLDVPSNVVHKKRVARNLFIKIRPSQEILKIRDGTSLKMEEILTYIKKPSKQIVAGILFFKIRPSQEILKIRDGTPLEAEEILIYIKKPSNKSVWHFSSKLDILSNVVQKKRVARILFFKIRPSQEILKIRNDVPSNVVHKKRVARNLFIKIRSSQEILKIRDGTSLEMEEILTYIKSPQNRSVWHFSSNLDVPINVVQKKRVARILFFKIRPSQEILKIRDVQNKRVARILFFKIRPSQEILKIRHGTPLETEEILTYIKSPQNRSFWNFYSNLDVPSNVVHKKRVARNLFIKIRPSQEILKIRDVQKKRVARILFFKIRPSQEILKIRHGTPSETEEILTYIKALKIDRFVARILFFKIRPSQEILKIRHGTSLEMEEILTYIKKPSKQIGLALFEQFRLQKKRVARILFFKIRPSQEILKIRHGTPLETEEILTYIKSPQNRSFCHFYSNLDVPSNVVHKKRVARNLFIKIRPSQEILKIRDDVPINVVQKKRVARILFFKIRPSQEILKIRHGTPLETEEILTYIKSPQNRSFWHFYSNLDVPSNVKRVARILFFKIRPSQEILKIRDGTPMEAEEILTYIKSPQNRSFWHFYSNLDVPSNVVHKKRVARNLFIKIRPSQEILKIRDGTSLKMEEILTYIKKPSKQIGLALFEQFRCPY